MWQRFEGGDTTFGNLLQRCRLPVLRRLGCKSTGLKQIRTIWAVLSKLLVRVEGNKLGPNSLNHDCQIRFSSKTIVSPACLKKAWHWESCSTACSERAWRCNLRRTQSMSFSQAIALVKWKHCLSPLNDCQIFTNLFHDSGGKVSFFTFDASSGSSATTMVRLLRRVLLS